MLSAGGTEPARSPEWVHHAAEAGAERQPVVEALPQHHFGLQSQRQRQSQSHGLLPSKRDSTKMEIHAPTPQHHPHLTHTPLQLSSSLLSTREMELAKRVQVLEHEVGRLAAQKDLLTAVLKIVREDLNLKNAQFDMLYTNLSLNPVWQEVHCAESSSRTHQILSQPLPLPPPPSAVIGSVESESEPREHQHPLFIQSLSSSPSPSPSPDPHSQEYESACAKTVTCLSSVQADSHEEYFDDGGLEVKHLDFINALPPELFFLVCDSLDYADLCASSCVCTSWNSALKDESVWQLVFLRKWFISSSMLRWRENQKSWKQQYADRLRLEKTWLESRPTVFTLSAHSGTVMCLRFDDRRLITGSDDGSMILWQLKSKHNPFLHKYASIPVAATARAPGPGPTSAFNRPLPSSSSSSGPCVSPSALSSKLGAALNRPIGVTVPTRPNSSSSSGSNVATTASPAPQLLQQHHKHTKKTSRLSAFHGHGGPVFCLDFADNTLVSGSYDKTVKVWNIQSGHNILTLRGHSNWVNCLQLGGNNRIVSGSYDATLKVWDLSTGRCLQTLSEGLQPAENQPGPPRRRVHNDPASIFNVAHCLQWPNHTPLLATGCRNRAIQIWDLNVGTPIQTLMGHTDEVHCLQWDYGNSQMASGSKDYSVRIWDVKSGRQQMTLEGHSNSVMALQFDDCYKLVSGSYDKTLRVWDIRMGKQLRTLVGHSSAVFCLQFDHEKIISGSADKRVLVWDFNNGDSIF